MLHRDMFIGNKYSGGDLLTLEQVADRLKVSKFTLRNWDKKGILKSIRVGFRKDRRYRREDVESYEQNQLLSIAEVSKTLHVSKQALRQWDERGILKPVRVGGRRDRFYRKEDVEKAMRHK